jgi:hypothetical protein
MTASEVQERLGRPSAKYRDGLGEEWGYRVNSPKGTEQGFLTLDFGYSGKVEHLKRSGRPEFAFPD